MASAPDVVVLTPVKDAAAHAVGYVDRLLALDYPADHLALGVLVSDSHDESATAFAAGANRLLAAGWQRATVITHDYGYRLPDGVPRWAPEVQLDRRIVLARSRNRLIHAAMGDAEWVLWLDADVVEFPGDILHTLLATGRRIVQPNCVTEWGGPSFDQNAWTDGGTRHLDDWHGTTIVELEAVGATMLLVHADLHRDGLVFPPVRYGIIHPRTRRDPRLVGRHQLGEVETEGLALMAYDMGERCWGLPDVEIRHDSV